VVINITSDKCYENKESLWGYREYDRMGGHDPYSSSKGCSELVTSAYRSAFFNHALSDGDKPALASARAGNVIGGGDWGTDRLIPDVVRALGEKKNVVVRSPASIRPWQYVLEPLSGYLLLAQKIWDEGAVYAQGWHFGPKQEDERSVGWLVQTFVEKWGEGLSWVISTGGCQLHEAAYLKLDCSKAKTMLGWRPRWGLEQALDATVDWYRAYLAGKDMHEITIAQIDAYTSSQEER
jgi:CDP-glucose 4,6-dehydratase